MNDALQIIENLRSLPADHEPDADDLWEAINQIEAGELLPTKENDIINCFATWIVAVLFGTKIITT
jgi:hypothetical protein